jgi:hypothetical protein
MKHVRAIASADGRTKKQVWTMGLFSFRSHWIGSTAKRFDTIAQGKRSAALGWRLGKNCEP